MNYLPRRDIRRLLAAAKALRERDWLMILTAYSHGLRASEVIRIKADDVRDGYLTVRRLKGSMKTIQPLLSSADPLFDERQALIDYAKQSNPSRPIFPVTRQAFWAIVKRAARSAGLPASRVNVVTLKHSIAMQTIGAAGINAVQKYLGHKSLSSTGYYLAMSDEEASRQVGRALRPRRRV